MVNEDNPFSGGTVTINERANFLAQLDPASIAEILVHQLKGEVWIAADQKWVVVDKNNKLMNDRGIRDIITMFQFFFNQNTVLSNLNERQISTKVEAFGEEIGELVALNWKSYEIDKAMRTAVCLSVTDIVDNALKRSLVGHGSGIITDKKLLEGTQRSHVQEIISDKQDSKKKGVLSMFK